MPTGSGARACLSSTSGSFRTVQACVDAHRPGDACEVGPGVYREGIESTGVSIVAAPDAPLGAVVLRGDAFVTGEWRQEGSGVWTTQLDPAVFPTGHRLAQVFYKGTHAVEARWPNCRFEELLDVEACWKRVSFGSVHGSLYDTDLRTLGVDWTGALLTLNADRRYWTFSRVVESFSAATGRANYTLPLADDWAALTRNQTARTRYYLSGTREALDAPLEWFHDAANGTLSFMPLGSGPPEKGSVSARVRDLCVVTHGAGVVLRGLTMVSCTFTMNSCNGCLAEDINITYPTLAREIGYKMIPHPKPRPNMTRINGNYSTINRVSVRHTDMGGILVSGSHNTVNDTLVYNTNWMGTLDFPAIQVGFRDIAPRCTLYPPRKGVSNVSATFLYPASFAHNSRSNVYGEHNVVSHTTVRAFGHCGIITSQLANEVRHSRILDGGLVGCDHAGIHADNLPAPCQTNASLANCSKHWHHNWVHSCREKCVRGDDGSVNLTVHSNVVFNCGQPLRDSFCGAAATGLAIKGDYHVVYANTVFNVSNVVPNHGDLNAFTALGPPPIHCEETDTCTPQNAHSFFLNMPLQRVRNGVPPGPVPVSRRAEGWAGVYQGAYATYDLEDPEGGDFRPRAGSPLVRAGAITERTPAVDGQPPNVGAMQEGEARWVPGCSIDPLC